MKAGPVKLKQLMKVIYNSLIPFKGFSAINLFGIVFARKEYKELSRRTLNHEAIHTAQMKEDTTDLEVITSFIHRIVSKSKDIDDEIQEVINEHFWEMV